VSADSYGELPMVGSPEYKPSNLPRVSLADVAELEDKEMVKFAGNVSTESTLFVHGLVKKTQEAVKSATIKDMRFISRSSSLKPKQRSHCLCRSKMLNVRFRVKG
jgi:aspartyl/asparaginyl-tRNA synthetase